jgi:hypothetical protein
MNDWQKQFKKKLDRVRSAAQERFEQFACEVLSSTFDRVNTFTGEMGVHGSAPLARQGMRTFKFELTENAYVLMTFRATGLDQCEVESEFVVPHAEHLPACESRVALLDADEQWARDVFQNALDHFADALAEAYETQPELVGAMPDGRP